VDRSALDRILKEREFQLTGLADESSGVRLGQLLSCQALVFGSIVAADERSAIVNFKLVSAETGELFGSFPRRVAMTSDVSTLLGREKRDESLLKTIGPGSAVSPSESSPSESSPSGSSLVGSSPFGIKPRAIASDTSTAKREYLQDGESWILAKPNEDYEIEITNGSDKTVGVALYIDGINTAFMRRELPSAGSKWILAPKSTTLIRGWQADMGSARKFVFAGKEESLAASKGYNAKIGIISASFFPEAPTGRGTQEAETKAGAALGSAVRSVQVNLEPTPAEVIVLRYDYRKGLEGRGIEVRE